MILIDNEDIVDPRLNLAIEEYVLTSLDMDEPYLFLYTNSPCIVVGKNQNTFEEINMEYVRTHEIPVVRRLSGGGAVYHDFGNLNFSFITKEETDNFRNFARFTEPIMSALTELGVEAKLTGRNDIQVGDKKISGNAQYTAAGRMLNHGTLTFDVDLDAMVSALNVKHEKIESKGIKSIRNRVANIRNLLQTDMQLIEFRNTLLDVIFQNSSMSTYRFTPLDWDRIHAVSRNRYDNWDWNYGKSPQWNMRHSKRFSIGAIEILLSVNGGYIERCKFYGDFFGKADTAHIEDIIVGCRYARDEIQQRIQNVKLSDYFGEMDMEAFLSLFECP